MRYICAEDRMKVKKTRAHFEDGKKRRGGKRGQALKSARKELAKHRRAATQGGRDQTEDDQKKDRNRHRP